MYNHSTSEFNWLCIVNRLNNSKSQSICDPLPCQRKKKKTTLVDLQKIVVKINKNTMQNIIENSIDAKQMSNSITKLPIIWEKKRCFMHIVKIMIWKIERKKTYKWKNWRCVHYTQMKASSSICIFYFIFSILCLSLSRYLSI